MTNSTEPKFYSTDDLPPVNDSGVARAAHDRIMARHLLATLRNASGKTLVDVAKNRGVTKAAIHQLENRPLTKVSVGSLVSYIQALGYPIDEDWVARTIVEALPTPTAV